MNRLNLLLKVARPFVTRLIYLGRNSGIHGLKYVFEEKGTKLSRFVWCVILFSFTGCLYLQLLPVVQRGVSISFTPDTRYVHWTTTFPAITICETYNPKTVLKKLDVLYPDLLKPLNFDYKRYVADLIYGRGVCTRSLCKPCGTPIPCSVPWRDIIENIHKNCVEMITDCRFNGKKFTCCDYFGKVDSEYGTCFSFNSLQSHTIVEHVSFITERYLDGVQFMVNRSTGPGILTFRLLYDSQVTIHSSEELSTNILDKKLIFPVKTNRENFMDILFSITEVDNEPLLQYEDVNVRKCRYNYEIPMENLHTYQVYSYGSCRLARGTEKSFEYCRCVHPVRDLSYKHLYCNYTGLNCLTTYEALKIKMGKEDSTDTEDCLSSCVESELNTIYISKRWVKSETNGTQVKIKMISLPTLRYQKNLLRTKTDLVVTVGGMVGLFFSASILSFAEIFYLILRKPNKLFN